MAQIRKLTDDFSVAPQLDLDDFPDLKAAGFRTVINNRPDGEAPDQPTSDEAKAAAEAAGLAYVHAPFAGYPTPEAIEAASTAQGPVLAYCRSGTRSATAWALSQAARGGMTAEDILSRAASAGYNLSTLKDALQRQGA